MDMKKCAAILHNQDLRKYNTVFYTIFLLKNPDKIELRKDVW